MRDQTNKNEDKKMNLKDYNMLLTPKVKRHIEDSVSAAIYEGNDNVCLNTDSILSNFGYRLNPVEYNCFDWQAAEDFLFEYADKLMKEKS